MRFHIHEIKVGYTFGNKVKWYEGRVYIFENGKYFYLIEN